MSDISFRTTNRTSPQLGTILTNSDWGKEHRTRPSMQSFDTDKSLRPRAPLIHSIHCADWVTRQSCGSEDVWCIHLKTTSLGLPTQCTCSCKFCHGAQTPEFCYLETALVPISTLQFVQLVAVPLYNTSQYGTRVMARARQLYIMLDTTYYMVNQRDPHLIFWHWHSD